MSGFPQTLSEMVAVAGDFCRLIDAAQTRRNDWLEALFELMPRLHAAVTALNSYDSVDMPLTDTDLDDRFELYSRLRLVLGERDGYWLEFDAAPEAVHMSGSLADDLTDIYFDLRHGLELLDDLWPQRAAQAWRSSYRLHWGQHLVDAERHLYALKVRNQLAIN
ncbi:MAG: DUF5063 domain-containing protein [Pseudomonadota bacterium]